MNVDAIVKAASFDLEPPSSVLPEWGRFLAEVCAADARAPAQLAHDPDGLRATDTGVLEPFLRAARSRLAASLVEGALSRLSDRAHRDLDDDLARELADLRACVVYDDVADDLRRDEWSYLLTTYPMLARLLAVRSLLWVESTAELIERLAGDSVELGDTFDRGREPGPAIAIEPALSHSREGRRNVARVTFASGLVAIYKPRPVAMEQWFFAAIAQLNTDGLTPTLRAAAVLPRDGYGWLEHIDGDEDSSRIPGADRYARGRPTPDEVALPPASEHEEYLHRLGMFWCLAYVLDAADFQRDNVVRSREHPVLVDIETLMSVDLSGEGERRTAVDVGFGDSMAATCRDRADFGRVLDGFESMYRFLLSSPASLGRHLGALAACETRVFLRDTRIYRTLHRRLCRAERLRSAREFRLGIDLLARAYVHRPEGWRPLLAEERRAVAQLDVPMFRMYGRSRTLGVAHGSVVEDFVETPGIDRVRLRLARLSEADLSAQLAAMSEAGG
ncbi:MAG: DUF4135 domain-containing protein [Vicinamibacterales bacterium]